MYWNYHKETSSNELIRIISLVKACQLDTDIYIVVMIIVVIIMDTFHIQKSKLTGRKLPFCIHNSIQWHSTKPKSNCQKYINAVFYFAFVYAPSIKMYLFNFLVYFGNFVVLISIVSYKVKYTQKGVRIPPFVIIVFSLWWIKGR